MKFTMIYFLINKKKQTGTLLAEARCLFFTFVYLACIRCSIHTSDIFFKVDKKCAKYINCLFLLDVNFKIIKSRKKEGNEIKELT